LYQTNILSFNYTLQCLFVGYQAKVVEQLKRNGAEVKISKRNVACYGEAQNLIKECMSMAPLGGLFNLAMVQEQIKIL